MNKVEKIPIKSSYTYLGVDFDLSQKYNKQTDKIINKINKN